MSEETKLETCQPFVLSTDQILEAGRKWQISPRDVGTHDMELFYTRVTKDLWLLDARILTDAWRKLPDGLREFLYLPVGTRFEYIAGDANTPAMGKAHFIDLGPDERSARVYWLDVARVPESERMRYRRLRLEMGAHELETLGEYAELYRLERGKAFLRDRHLAWGENPGS